MTGFENIIFIIKSQAFIKFIIILLTMIVNTLLVEKPSPGAKWFVKDFWKQMVFVLLVFLVFSPALTPALVIVLGKVLIWASAEALNQLSFGIILLSSRHIIIRAKIFFNNQLKKDVK